MMYIILQSIVRPNIIFGIIGIVVHVIGQYIMLFQLNLGIEWVLFYFCI